MEQIEILKSNGVIFKHPATVLIEDDVCMDNIAEGVVIYGGCRISGASTSIGPGTVLGQEAPVTLENCQLGARVKLAGGYFNNVTLLDGVEVGSGAHMRPGTLLEENASCAHAVGLKQTILMPYVTLGSLINFCDILMAGGTSRNNHSEVGSSYVHFNYTPHQDKATPSLLGDVAHGVMLDQPPVFLGGQGGLVGPSSLEFGTVIGAGTVYSGNIDKPYQLVSGGKRRNIKPKDYNPAIYGSVNRVVANNFSYIGNLFALREWYRHVRVLFMTNDRFSKACYDGALVQIDCGIEERIKRLNGLAENLLKSIDVILSAGMDVTDVRFAGQTEFVAEWPMLKEKLKYFDADDVATDKRSEFLEAISETFGNGSYLEIMPALDDAVRLAGVEWMQAVVKQSSCPSPRNY